MHSVLNPQPIGRIIIGIVIFFLLIAIVIWIMQLKKNNKLKLWLIPFNLKSSSSLIKNSSLIKTDYIIWASLSGFFLIYWLGGYWIVNLIQLGQYNNAIQSAINNETIIQYIWNPEKIISNGNIGGFDAILKKGDGETTYLMPFVMKQTNVTYYLFNLVNTTLNGNNIQNHNNPFFEIPGTTNPLKPFPNLTNDLDPYDVHSDYFYNTFIRNQLDDAQRTFINGIMNQWMHSFVFSNILFTPLCQFLSVVFPLSIIFSYKKDFVSYIAPWALLGGLITMYGGIVADPSVHVTIQLIFYDQQMFFVYHLYLLTVGTAWVTYNSRYSLNGIFGMYVFIAVYVAIVLILAYSFDIKYFTTGMTELDYSISGSYEIVPDVLHNTNFNFPVSATLMILLFTTVINILISIKNLSHYYFQKKCNLLYRDSFFNDIKNLFKKCKNDIRNLFKKCKKIYK